MTKLICHCKCYFFFSIKEGSIVVCNKCLSQWQWHVGKRLVEIPSPPEDELWLQRQRPSSKELKEHHASAILPLSDRKESLLDTLMEL